MKKIKISALICTTLIIALAIMLAVVPASAASSTVTNDSFHASSGLNLTLGEDYAYSFAVVGDTQTLNYNDIKQGTDNMSTMYQWIVDNKDTYNIQYVLGLGDITDQHYVDTNSDGTKKDAQYLIKDRSWNEAYANDPDYNEWYHAMKAVSLLNGEIDYSLVRGNHDDAKHHTKFIDQYNSAYRAQYTNDPTNSGFYNGNLENSYRKVVINGVKYMIITLDVGQDDAMLAWLDGVLDMADDEGYKVVVTLHEFLNTDASILDTTDTTIIPSLDGFAVPDANDPRELWETVLRKHESVHMILSGHIDSDYIRYSQARGDNGNTVTQFLIDPQHIDLYGDSNNIQDVGMVAMFYFSADGSVVNIEYISTIRATDAAENNTDAYLPVNELGNGIKEYSYTINLDFEWVKASETSAHYVPEYVAENTKDYPFVAFLDDDNDPNTTNFYLGAYSSLLSAAEVKSQIPESGAFVENVGRVKVGGASANVNKNLTYLLMRDFDVKNGGDEHGYYKLTGQLTGIHSLDLNGHTFTLASNNLFTPLVSRTDANAPTYNIYGGNIVIAGGGSVIWIGNNTCGVTANLYDLNISYASTASSKAYIIRAYEWAGTDWPSETNISVNIDNCTFDFRSNLPAGYTMFSLTASGVTNESVDLAVENSKILMKSTTEITGFNIATFDENDKITLADTFTLEMPTPASAPYSSFTLPEGERRFTEISATNGTSTYNLQPLVNDFSSVPEEYLDANTYPFLLFQNGKFLCAEKNWLYRSDGTDATAEGVMISIRNKANGNYPIDLIMRRNYDYSADSYDKWFGHFNNTLNIDMCDYEFTCTTGWAAIFRAYSAYTNRSAKITVSNGKFNLLANQTPLIELGGTIVLNKPFEITFNNINFCYASGAKEYAIVKTSGTSVADLNVTFNDCNFDFATNTPSGKTPMLADLSTHTESVGTVNVYLNGGTLKVSDYAKFKMANIASANDSLTLGKGSDGRFVDIVVDDWMAPPADTFYDANGNMLSRFMRRMDFSSGSPCLVYSYFNEADGVMIDGYGKVPAEYADAEKWPFLSFIDGKFFKADEHWLERLDGTDNTADGLLITVRKNIWGNTIDSVMRRDYEINDGRDPWLAHCHGTVNINLGGYTIQGSSSWSTFLSNSSNQGSGRTPIYNVSNGTVLLRNGALIQDYNSGTSGNDSKTAYFNFNKVNIGFAAGATETAPLKSAAGTAGTVTKSFITFTDCNFDFYTNVTDTDATKNKKYTLADMSASGSEHNASIVINGGKIRVNNPKNFTLANITSGSDSFAFGKGTAGYPEIEANDWTNNPGYSIKNTADEALNVYFKEWRVSGSSQIRVFTYYANSECTNIAGYGLVPNELMDEATYPFLVFQGGKFFTAEKCWMYNSSNADISFSGVLLTVRKFAGTGSSAMSVLMRRDYDIEIGYDKWFAHSSSGVVDINLDGYTLRTGTDPLFDNQNNQGAGRKPQYTVSNGTVLIYKGVLIREKNSASFSNDGKTATFIFNNVRFGFAEGTNKATFITTESSTATTTTLANITFTNCSFDLVTNAPSAVTLIDASASGSNHKMTVTVNGCSMKIGNTAFTMANLTQGYDTLTFAKHDGNYLTVEVAKGAGAPAGDFASASGKLVFMKTAGTQTTDIYELTTEAVANLDFTPKASVTLDSTLIFNIYLPDHAGLGTVTLNGETVTLGEANEGYYVISTPLMASESAEELKLVVNLTVDGTTLKGSFTFSTVKYAEKLLATAGISTAEQTLAKDMLAYINSAYVFFNGSAVAEITALLDGYTSTTTINKDNAKKTVPGLSGATFTLEAKPTVQFFFAEGFGYEDFTFKVGGRTLTVADVEEKTDEYVKFALFAYEMTEDFTYTVGGEPGAYNLIAYYAYASGTGNNDYNGEDKAELTDLAAKFYNYCLSAKAYRQYVIANQ